jgi:hypothetical protein
LFANLPCVSMTENRPYVPLLVVLGLIALAVFAASVLKGGRDEARSPRPQDPVYQGVVQDALSGASALPESAPAPPLPKSAVPEPVPEPAPALEPAPASEPMPSKVGPLPPYPHH